MFVRLILTATKVNIESVIRNRWEKDTQVYATIFVSFARLTDSDLLPLTD